MFLFFIFRVSLAVFIIIVLAFSIRCMKINELFPFFLKSSQSNEVKGSYHMELEGYKRMTKYVKKSGHTIGKLVTDRHRQLAKYIREKSPEILHMYDVWHVAKCKLVWSPPVFIFKGSPIPSIFCPRSYVHATFGLNIFSITGQY